MIYLLIILLIVLLWFAVMAYLDRKY